MGENIADLGGALVALEAYHLSLGKEAPVIDGLRTRRPETVRSCRIGGRAQRRAP